MHATYLNRQMGRTLAGVLLVVSSLYASQAFSQGSAARVSWRHLLYYSSRSFGHDTSLVDSPDFFLAADGASNSDHELSAFIAAIQSDSMQKPEAERMACRFPARTDWLRRNRPEISLPVVTCPEYESWLAISQPKAVSIIFSSYYVNNPSSMMGHTFLRLRRGGKDAAPLLDKAVNFAAEPEFEIPFLYSIQGLIGSFPGRFALMPYYSKVQEYANAESRDLWEYNLSLTEAETLLMMASLWEVAPTRIDYFFLDENCSAVLIYLLQTARPGLAMNEKLGFFVHPSDTLRILMDEPGLVEDVTFRPSTRSRYLAQRSGLSEGDQALLRSAVQAGTEDLPAYRALPAARKAALLDTLLAFIEFDERLYGSKAPVKNAKLYDRVLLVRSKIGEKPLTLFEEPRDEAPHLGHRGQRLGLGLGRYEDRYESILEYRPGQHDLLSPSIGYPPELSIELGKTRLAIEEGGMARIRSAELFNILSFNPTASGRFPFSWHMQLNYENTETKSLNLRGGVGSAWVIDERDHYLFALFDMHVMDEEWKLWACPGASVGGRWSFHKRLVTVTRVGAEKCFSSDTRPWIGLWTHEWRWSIDESWEIYWEAQKKADSHELALGFYRYY